MRTGTWLVVALALASAACGTQENHSGKGSGGKADDLNCSTGDAGVELAADFGSFRFMQPTAAVQHPLDDQRWYVAEQRGVLWTLFFEADGTVTPNLFADLRSIVDDRADESGLFSVAFDPNFAQSGRVYLSYTGSTSASPVGLESRVSRFVSLDEGVTLDASSEEILLAEPQPFANHNGGQIAFGPDGHLYIGLGDGGSAGDPQDNAQDKSSRLGKILRLDVSGSTAAAPIDNPFVGADGLDEIYALGLRNPWRFSFDLESGELWLADVGQNAQEEIDIIEKGGNYGWKVREGSECFEASVCADDFREPIAEYGRTDGISITGGFVYRGQELPELEGAYVYGDFGSGSVWSLRRSAVTGDVEIERLLETRLNPSSFAQGRDGEIFVLDYSSGGIFRLSAGETEECIVGDGGLSPEFETAPVSFDALYEQVIATRCSPCHTQRAMGGLRMVNADAAFQELVEREAATADCAGRTRVVPGEAESSVLFQKVSGVNLCGPIMPPNLSLSDTEVEAVRAWIEAGAER